jgi:hypothetical protein
MPFYNRIRETKTASHIEEDEQPAQDENPRLEFIHDGDDGCKR